MLRKLALDMINLKLTPNETIEKHEAGTLSFPNGAPRDRPNSNVYGNQPEDHSAPAFSELSGSKLSRLPTPKIRINNVINEKSRQH